MPIIRSGYATHTRNGSTRAWRTTRALLLANATHCGICHQPLGNEPTEADHIIARSYGGLATRDNLRAVHRTCNRRRGAGS